jgi:hypothetical protein
LLDPDIDLDIGIDMTPDIDDLFDRETARAAVVAIAAARASAAAAKMRRRMIVSS